jgi:hypothetical protein
LLKNNLEIIENFPAGIFVSIGILLPAILLSIHKKSMKKEIIEEPLFDIEDSLD